MARGERLVLLHDPAPPRRQQRLRHVVPVPAQRESEDPRHLGRAAAVASKKKGGSPVAQMLSFDFDSWQTFLDEVYKKKFDRR